jgi:serine/threonine protein phosphatase PrpC
MNCGVCGTWAAADDRYCEACGHEFVNTRWVSTTGRCGNCIDGDAHEMVNDACRMCRQRATTAGDMVKVGIDGIVGLSHRGHTRRRNEDAVAVGRTDTVAVAVVCDGVSTSSASHTAARTAVDTGIHALLAALSEGLTPRSATLSAAQAAIGAVTGLSEAATRHNPPCCTYVSTVVTADQVVVGWIGDSRAYWLADTATASSACLTVDDTLAGQLRMVGVPTTRYDADAAALIRWVGADAGAVEPNITTYRPTGRGRVLLCTDGLTRYVPGARDLADAVTGDAHEAAAHLLTQLALDAGGKDNITVVLVPFPPFYDRSEPGPTTGARRR